MLILRNHESIFLFSFSGVRISDIDFYPGAQRLTVSCQAYHKGNLRSVDIRRQFKDGYEPVATALKASENETTVLVFPNNVTYKKVERKYEMLLSVTFDPFDCNDLTNFSCAVITEDDTASETARITSEFKIKFEHILLHL